jgi:hypothetical protein
VDYQISGTLEKIEAVLTGVDQYLHVTIGSHTVTIPLSDGYFGKGFTGLEQVVYDMMVGYEMRVYQSYVNPTYTGLLFENLETHLQVRALIHKSHKETTSLAFIAKTTKTDLRRIFLACIDDIDQKYSTLRHPLSVNRTLVELIKTTAILSK